MMKSAQFLFLLTASFVATAFAQQIGYLDLTATTAKERVREPKGARGFSCGRADHTYYPEIMVQLLWLDSVRYTLGEEVTFEVKIQNIGREPITVPWAANLADFEPHDPAASYSYLEGTISLGFAKGKQEFFIFANSYGSPEVAGTLRQLRPEEWVVVRGRSQLLTSDTWVLQEFRNANSMSMRVRADFMLSNTQFLPAGNHEKPTENSSCVNINTKRSSQLDVAIHRVMNPN
jgi:hypothetical protein